MQRYLSAMTIRAKIVLAFALIICGTVALGLVSLNRLNGVDAAAAQVRDDALPSTRALGRMAQTSERLRLDQ